MDDSPEVEIAFVSVDLLRFDPENPRLPTTIDGNNEQAVLEWMIEDASLIELMGSIGVSGYFAGEPLLVVKKDSIYTVVEGNRRLSAVKLLLNPQLAPDRRKKSILSASEEAKHKPDRLPVVVFAARAEILDYLGYRHVTGVKQWDPLAKARYLQQLLNSLQDGLTVNEKHRVLAKSIGSRADYVARLLTGLALYHVIEENSFFDIPGLGEDQIKFSLLTTAVNYENIAKFLGLESSQDVNLSGLSIKNLEELTSWLFEKDNTRRTRIGESRNLSVLSEVVASDKALAAFRDGRTLQDAEILTGAPEEIFSSSISSSKASLTQARDVIHLISIPQKTDADILGEIYNLARILKHSVENLIHEKQ